jgi:hypothetical protein
MPPEMQFVVSGNIEAIGYDADNRELYVRYLKSGLTYIYSNVDEIVFTELQMADSKGSYVNQNIRNNYEFRKL